MNIKAQMTAIGILGIVFGLAYLVAPATLLGFFGLQASPAAAYAARFFGGSAIGWGVLGLTARGVPGRAGLGAIAGAFFLTFLIGMVLTVWGTIAGIMNGYGWIGAALFAALTLAMGTYRFTGRGS